MCPEAFIHLNAVALGAISPWGVPVMVMEETTSSNDEMLALGERGAPNGSLLFAENQTAGRGRFHRPWSTTPGLGLYFSLLLRLEINDSTIPSLSAFAAVAIVETLRELAIGECTIKSPNDVLIGGRKVAGVLVETRCGKSHFAVVGIGLNVNHAKEDFPPELQDRAGSLAMTASGVLERAQVASILLKSLWHHEILMRSNLRALPDLRDGMEMPSDIINTP